MRPQGGAVTRGQSVLPLAASDSHTDAVSASPNRILIGSVAAVTVLAVVAVVVAALRPAAEYDPASPEGTVQAYLQRLLKGAEEEALAYVDPDSGCSFEDARSAWVPSAARVLLVSTDSDEDRAEVEVRIIESSSSGPFDSYEFSREEVFRLRRDGDGWLITGEPWPLFFCRGSSP